jgi:hypothetical protein
LKETLKAYRPKYTGDEILLGLVLTIAIHVIPGVLIGWKILHPPPPEPPEEELVAKPIIAAQMLKLGKIDPNKLPQRLKPIQNTAPKADILASSDDPLKKHDAGPPEPLAKDSPNTVKTDKNDLFAEDGGRPKTAEGNPAGVDGGTETDPSKVRGGSEYAGKLTEFFKQRWSVPSVITGAEAARLCVTFQFQIDRRMHVWYIKNDAVKKSGNDLFDDSARSMLQKLRDDNSGLPDPPPEVENLYRGRTVQLVLTFGDPSKCN